MAHIKNIQIYGFCMIMRKKVFLYIQFSLSRPTENLLQGGLALIFLSLLRLLLEICSSSPFSPATASRFGAMLEHVLAALALLTGICCAVEYACRHVQKK